MIGSQMIAVWLFRIALMTSFQHLGFGEIIQTFYIEDPQGYESSFLIDGGKVVIICTDTDNGTVTFKIRRNQKSYKKIPQESPGYNYVNLNAALLNLNEDYVCDDSSGVKLTVKAIRCNPFLLTPPILSCTAAEHCLVYNASSFKCGKKIDHDCFLTTLDAMKSEHSDSLPKPRVVCTTKKVSESPENEITQYGLCHARDNSNKTFEGLTGNAADCLDLNDLVFNGLTVKQDKLLFTTKNPSTWTITYDDTAYYKKCVAYGSDNKKIATYEAKKLNNLVKIESIMPSKLPAKFRLSCNISGHSLGLAKDWTISTFLIMYDKAPNLYTAEMRLENSTKKRALDLICECKTPQGFFCSLSWEDPKKSVNIIEYSQSAKLIKKTILEDDHHAAAVEYSCFLRVWASNYPVNFQLVNVPDISVISDKKTVTKEDFKNIVTKKGGDADNDRNNSSSGVNNDGNEQDDNASKGSSNTLIYVIVAVLAIVVIVGILAGVFVLRRMRLEKKKNDEKIEAAEKEEIKLEEERKLADEIEKKANNQKEMENKARMELINKLKADKDHQRTDDDLMSFYRNKSELTKIATELDPEKDTKKRCPKFGLAIEQFPEHIYIRKEFISMEKSEKERAKIEPPVCGHLICCRYPAMRCPRKTFVHQEHVDKLIKEKPTHEQHEERHSTTKPIALNANYVRNLHNEKYFILTQAPRLVDMELYFDMIIQKNVKLIVTLLSADELPDDAVKLQKFYPYFTIPEGKHSEYGPYTLYCALKIESTSKTFTTSSFHIIKKGSPSTKEQPKYELTILSYSAWGDFSSAGDCSHILSLNSSMSTIMSKYKTANDEIASQVTKTKGIAGSKTESRTVDFPKVIVHCSAGLGRSGTLVAAINLLEYLQIYGRPVNIRGIAEFVREDREGAIQTLEQFIQIYWIAANFVRNKFQELAPKTLNQQLSSKPTKTRTEDRKK